MDDDSDCKILAELENMKVGKLRSSSADPYLRLFG
jgi:hypothetical protein